MDTRDQKIRDLLFDLREGEVHSRGDFSLDLARARQKMETHLGLAPADYAVYFVQLAALCGASEVFVRMQGDWVEWGWDGPSPSPAQLKGVLDPEALGQLSDVDYVLNLCLSCAAATDYRQRELTVPGGALQTGAGGWQFKPARGGQGVRLRLRVTWSQLASRLMRGNDWLARQPECELLDARSRGSSVRLRLPWKDRTPSVSTLVRIEGRLPLGNQPLPAERVIQLEWPAHPSGWWAWEGDGLALLSEGLAYEAEPFLPGRFWLSLGPLATDLPRKKLIRNAALSQGIWAFSSALQEQLPTWVAREELVRAGLDAWVYRCLGGSGPGADAWKETWEALPVIPLASGGRISCQGLDEQYRAARVIWHLEKPPAPGVYLPCIVLAQKPALDFCQARYERLESALPLIAERQRELQLRQELEQAAPLDYSRLDALPWSFALTCEAWSGWIGFDPDSLEPAVLESALAGRRLGKQSMPELGPGLTVMADHPDFPVSPEWDGPAFDCSARMQLLSWLRQHQLLWLAPAFARKPTERLRERIMQVFQEPRPDLDPALELVLWGSPGDPCSTISQLLEAIERRDLRDWLDRDRSLEELEPILRRHPRLTLGWMTPLRAYQSARRAWLERPSRPPELPALPPALARHKGSSFAGWLAIVPEQREARAVLSRELRLIYDGVPPPAGGRPWPPCLILAADHPELRLDVSGLELDPASEGWKALSQAVLEEASALAPDLPLDSAAQLMGWLPLEHWPDVASPFSRLDQQPLSWRSLAEASLQRRSVPVLVDPLSRTIVEGYAECWLLTPSALAWFDALLPQAQLENFTTRYHEAFRRMRFDRPEAAPCPVRLEDGDWLLRAPVVHSEIQGELGLTLGEGAGCEVLVHQAGRPVLRLAPKLLDSQGAPGSVDGSPTQGGSMYRVRGAVDWPGLQFAREAASLQGRPAYRALMDAIETFGFRPPLAPFEFLRQRLEWELRERELEYLDARLLDAPIFPSEEGDWSLRRLMEAAGSGRSVPYASTPGQPGVQVTQAQKEWLGTHLPRLVWRDGAGPSPAEAARRKLLRSPQRWNLPDRPYLHRETVEGEMAWGLTREIGEPSRIELMLDGRRFSTYRPSWPYTLEARLNLPRVEFDDRGQWIQEDDVLLPILDRLRRRVEAYLGESSHSEYRAHLWFRTGAAWLRPDRLFLPGLDGELVCLQDWLASYGPPRPYVTAIYLEPHPDLPRLPVLESDWVREARQSGKALECCDLYFRELARRVGGGRPHQRPPLEWSECDEGALLGTGVDMRETVVVTVACGCQIRRQQRQEFPPFYVELDVTGHWRTQTPEPSRRLMKLGRDWWRRRIESAPAEAEWLQHWAGSSTEGPWAALLQRRWEETHAPAEEWDHLRLALQTYLGRPVLVQVQEREGPMPRLNLHGLTVYLSFSPDGPLFRQRSRQVQMANVVIWASIHTPGRASVGQVLRELEVRRRGETPLTAPPQAR